MASPLPAICWANRTVSKCMTVEEIDAAFKGLQEMDQRERDTALMLAEKIFLKNLREETGQKEWAKLKTFFNVAKTLAWVSGNNIEKEVRKQFNKEKNDNRETMGKVGTWRHLAAKICEHREENSHPMTKAVIEEVDASKILKDIESAHGVAYMKLMVRLEDRFKASEKPPAQSKNLWDRFRGKKPGL